MQKSSTWPTCGVQPNTRRRSFAEKNHVPHRSFSSSSSSSSCGCFCWRSVTYLGLKTVTGLFLAWPIYLVTILLAAILEFGQFKGISHFKSWQSSAVRCSWHPFGMTAASSPFIHFALRYFRPRFGVFLG